MKDKILELVENTLTHHGLPCKTVNLDNDITNTAVVVDTGMDRQNRQRSLVVFTQELDFNVFKDNQAAVPPQNPFEGAHHLKKKNVEYFLYVSSLLPFHIADEAIGETARLIVYLNNALDLPGFGFDERNNIVYFRYAFIKPQGNITEESLMAFLGMTIFTVETFSDLIETVAQGKKTMVDAITDSYHELSAQKAA